MSCLWNSRVAHIEPIYCASNSAHPGRHLRMSNGGACPLLSFLAEAFVEQCSIPTAVYIQRNISPVTLTMLADAKTDIALSHERSHEAPYLEQGIFRNLGPIFDIQLILIGPTSNPACIAASDPVATAFSKVAAALGRGEAVFHSRGDQSVTHCLETECWRQAGIDPAQLSNYSETHFFPSDAVVNADKAQAYAFVDYQTWSTLQPARSKLYLVCARNTCHALVRSDADASLAQEWFEWVDAQGRDLAAWYPVREKPHYLHPFRKENLA